MGDRMIHNPFFNHKEDKCPVCGTFTDEKNEEIICKNCYTKFNKFMILEMGREVDMENN